LQAKLAIEVAQSLTCLYIDKGEATEKQPEVWYDDSFHSGDYDEAEAMITACIQMHQEEESTSFLKVQELLQLVVTRKEASDALTRLRRAQKDANPTRSPLKQTETESSESNSLKTPIRISTVRSTSTHSAANFPSTQQFSGSNIESPPIAIAQSQLQPSPSSARSRPAYASASKTSDTAALDATIVSAWADYIEKWSIPREAPSIPLSLNIGVAVPPGFETHYKVAAFALAKSRRSQNK
jgi:hypothetical protein